MIPEQPSKLRVQELNLALSHIHDAMAAIDAKSLDMFALARQLQPCQVEVMQLYIRAVSAGLFPRWIDPPNLSADDATLLHAWAALALRLPELFPGQVMSIQKRAASLLPLDDKRYKAVMYDEDLSLLVVHAKSMVKFLQSRLTASAAFMPELIIDLETYTVHYQGESYPVTENQARALKLLQDAGGHPVASALMKNYADSSERPERWLKTLPKPLRDLIKKKPGTGSWLQPPPK